MSSFPLYPDVVEGDAAHGDLNGDGSMISSLRNQLLLTAV